MRKITRTSLLLAVSLLAQLAVITQARAGVCDTPPTPVCFSYDTVTKIVTLRPTGTLADWYFGVSLDGSTYSCHNVQANNCEGTERLASNPPSPAKFWITHKDPTNLGICANKLFGRVNVSTGAFCTGSATCTPTAHTLCYSGTPGLFTLSRGSGSSADNSTLQLTWTMSVDATKYDVYQDSTKVVADTTGLDATLNNVCGTHSYYVRAKNNSTSTTPSNSITITSPACSPPSGTTYYALSRCPNDGAKYYTTTVVSNSGQRVYSGGGMYYVFTGTSISSSTPPANSIGPVSVQTGMSGCP